MKKQLIPWVLIWILTPFNMAQEYPKPLNTLELGYHDTLVFLGDSITHQCLYTQYVEDYYYTQLDWFFHKQCLHKNIRKVSF